MKTLPAPEGFKPATREEFYAVLNPSPGIGLIVNKYEKNGRYGYALTCAYLDARRAGFVHTAAAFASLIRNHPERTRA